MTDTEVTTPNKRKSFSAQPSAKKQKLNNGAQQKGKTPNKSLTPKHQKSPKGIMQKGIKKSNQKKKDPESEGESPQKMKPFAGVSGLNKKESKLAKKNENKTEVKTSESGQKKKRRAPFHLLFTELRTANESKKKELLKKIENKIQTIQSRPEKTKTAKRKLNYLFKMKNIAEGNLPKEKVQQLNQNKTAAKARRERKKATKDLQKQATKGKNLVALDKKGENTETKKTKKIKNIGRTTILESKIKDSDESESEESSEEEEAENAEIESASDEGSEVDGEEENSDEEGGEEDSGAEENDGSEEEDSDESDADEAPKGRLHIITKTEDLNNSKVSPEEDERKPNKLETSRGKPKTKLETCKKSETNVGLDIGGLQKNELIKKDQKRFVLFIGNIPYDTNKQDIIQHFNKSGELLHVRIPLEKKTNKPRGFAYLEVKNEQTYQKCLSMHHTFLKDRRINVLYTQGGKKKPEERKKDIKAKNLKLHAMRKQGKLAGSIKENQKRSFRRTKKKNAAQSAN